MYKAADGMIMCATDFSFVELCVLAQVCYSRYGHSAMRDIINAEVDPHRWFSGVRLGIIDNDTSFSTDPEKAAALEKMLEEKIDKHTRQESKGCNFGFPGGMRAKRFREHSGTNGHIITLEKAAELRDSWMYAFSEMNKFMIATRMQDGQSETMSQFGYSAQDGNPGKGPGRTEEDYDDDDDEEEDEGEDEEPNTSSRVNMKFGEYESTLLTGMHRTRCTYNSALNFQFQGLAAQGVKWALWNLAMAGYLPRLVNMIHDEVLYMLYPDELDTCIPEIERLMIAGMRKVTPDVKIGVETSCMLHWDKGATEFHKLKKDENGHYIIKDPEYIQELMQTTKDY